MHIAATETLTILSVIQFINCSCNVARVFECTPSLRDHSKTPMYQPSSNMIDKALLASLDTVLAPLSYAEPLHWPISDWHGAAKRAMDIVIALLLLAAFAVAMLLIAMAIRLESPGPVLFRQRRIGLDNVGFEMWKFRTMHHHAPEARQADADHAARPSDYPRRRVLAANLTR